MTYISDTATIYRLQEHVHLSYLYPSDILGAITWFTFYGAFSHRNKPINQQTNLIHWFHNSPHNLGIKFSTFKGDQFIVLSDLLVEPVKLRHLKDHTWHTRPTFKL